MISISPANPRVLLLGSLGFLTNGAGNGLLLSALESGPERRSAPRRRPAAFAPR
jgi:hypothetical protein